MQSKFQRSGMFQRSKMHRGGVEDPELDPLF